MSDLGNYTISEYRALAWSLDIPFLYDDSEWENIIKNKEIVDECYQKFVEKMDKQLIESIYTQINDSIQLENIPNLDDETKLKLAKTLRLAYFYNQKPTKTFIKRILNGMQDDSITKD